MDTIDCAPTRESKLALPYVLTRCVTITCLSNVGILFLGSGTETLILYNVSLIYMARNMNKVLLTSVSLRVVAK